jgi:hypothetical protein
MKYVINIFFVFVFVSCFNNPERSGEKEVHEQNCEVLDLSDTILDKFTSVKEIRQSNVDMRLKLSENQMKPLFDLNGVDSSSEGYLYSVKKVRDNLFVLFVYIESLTNNMLYMITMDCSSKILDHVYFSECDYFDVIKQDEYSETGLFITKHFKILNDTNVSSRKIIIEEKKNLEDGAILTSQKDSITYDYYIRETGKIELMHSDSVRINN